MVGTKYIVTSPEIWWWSDQAEKFAVGDWRERMSVQFLVEARDAD